MISAGAYGYPWDEALDIAKSEILSFLNTHEMEVFLVIFRGKARQSGRREDAVFQAFLAEKADRTPQAMTSGGKPGKTGLSGKKKLSDSSVYSGPAPRPKPRKANEAVPVENSLMLATALKKEGINTELHIYSHGCHGTGLGNALTAANEGKEVIPEIQSWPGLLRTWLERNYPITLKY